MTLTLATIESLETVFRDQGARALIDAASLAGTNDNDVSALWCAAMTATFGPTHLHKDWTNVDGTPSAECLASFPDVARAVESAKEKIPQVLSAMRRRVEREVSR